MSDIKVMVSCLEVGRPSWEHARALLDVFGGGIPAAMVQMPDLWRGDLGHMRNVLVKFFMDQPEFSHLLVLSPQVAFPAGTLNKLLAMGENCVGLACRIPGNTNQAVYGCTFPQGEVVPKEGALEVTHLGEECLLLSRACITKMIEAYGPTLTYADTSLNMEVVGLFTPRTIPAYLSSGAAFCERWKVIGGNVKCLIDTTTLYTRDESLPGHAGQALQQFLESAAAQSAPPSTTK